MSKFSELDAENQAYYNRVHYGTLITEYEFDFEDLEELELETDDEE